LSSNQIKILERDLDEHAAMMDELKEVRE